MTAWTTRLCSVAVMIIAAFIALGHAFNRRKLPPQPADVALVFGAGQPWKVQSRCAMAAELYHCGLVRNLLVSGGVPVPGTGMLEAPWFRDRLVALGVPAERILMESRATNTAENVRYALPIIQARGFTSVVLIMSDFEGIRAHLTAKRAWRGSGLTIYDCHAPSTGYWNPWTWWLSRSGWELTWYTLPRLFRYRLLPYLFVRS